MRRLWLITKEDFKNLIFNPMWVFYSTIFPVSLILILGYLTRNEYGNEVTSYDYYGITLMLYSVLNSGMTSANAFMEERIKKPNMRIIYAPGNVKDIFLSKILASTAFSWLLHLIDLLFLAFVMHVNLQPIGWVLILFALSDAFAVTLGIMLCCIMKSEQATNQVQSMIVNLLAVLGGVLFSLDGYGEVVRHISLLSPVKWIVKALFGVIYDGNNQFLIPAILVLMLGIAIMIVISSITFRKEDCIC